MINDCNGKELAVTNLVTSVAGYPPAIEHPGRVAGALSEHLKVDLVRTRKKLSSDKQFVWIKRHVSPRQVFTLKRLMIDGIGFIPEHSRYYPNRTLAAQVLGFTGIDGRGLEGIEFHYNRFLKGSTSKQKILRDALGRGVVRASLGTEPVVGGENLPQIDGNHLTLTIDATIQYFTENALKKGVLKSDAKSGIAIVMDPKTGAVLSIAHYPFFNPNAFRQFSRSFWRNRAITDPFEPGSTMKIFSAAAAIDKGIAEADSIFFCENGAYRIGDDTVHDTRPHGWLTLQKIVKYSSNIGAVKIAEKMGPQVLYNGLRDFGFGQKTGIDCPGETGGSLSHYNEWAMIDTGAIAFGHGISVSAIQLITAMSAIANNGMMMKPYIVRSINNVDNSPVTTFEPQKIRQVISPGTAGIVRQIMASVVEEGGTGHRAALEGYTACGKTGTAQKVDHSGAYTQGKYCASFLGFLPEDDPCVSILVIIDEPKNNYYGGLIAAPVFKEIAHETMNYFNIPPKKRAAEPKKKGGNA